MSKKTTQTEAWSSEFGKSYTDRNPHTFEQMERDYMSEFGITRSSLNHEFLDGLPRSMKILEVGCNAGSQLLGLQQMGFENLYGIELQHYAVELSKENCKKINIIQGSAFDAPFKDGFFDMVYTSGVLIHISPNDIKDALKEIYRCSKKYIWGCEYYAEKYTEVESYRGENNLLWKTNFAQLYVDTFPDLKIIKEKKFKYLATENVDSMFLLEK